MSGSLCSALTLPSLFAVQVCEWLLKNGADVAVLDRFGNTPLDDAIEAKHGEIIKSVPPCPLPPALGLSRIILVLTLCVALGRCVASQTAASVQGENRSQKRE